MSREEAAAKALYERLCGTLLIDVTLSPWDELSEWEKTSSIGEARTELAAADAHDAAHGIHRISLDDATVERAARALLDAFYDDKTLKVDDEDRNIARAVLAAAVEADQ